MDWCNNTFSQRLNFLYQQIWQLSPRVDQIHEYNRLAELTGELIKCYEHQGRLAEHPFDAARLRKLSVPTEQLRQLLDDSVCLITGGLGCVGTRLTNELLGFPVRKIILLDKKDASHFTTGDSRVEFVQCDVLDKAHLESIFSSLQPHYIFHTAAERDPGLSEKKIMHAVFTNVLGTYNTAEAAFKSPSVRQMVFSSTGKASRYYTNEVYAATKKICEYIMSSYARRSQALFSMVRFTHILDNSLMDISLRHQSLHNDFVGVHSPGKYVTAQNIGEAADLMLNALVYSQKHICNFLIVRNLEWPAESLEIALYFIRESGRGIPIVFMGNPNGYTEKFFRGQLDWSMPQELNLLINVYENKRRRINEMGDILISNISACSDDILAHSISKIARATNDEQCRLLLLEALKEMVADSLIAADKNDTLTIIKWGTDSRYLELENNRVSDFTDILSLLVGSLQSGGEMPHPEKNKPNQSQPNVTYQQSHI